VESRNDEKNKDREEKCKDTPQFIGDGSEDSVGKQEVPLWLDMGRGNEGVSWDKIIRVPEKVGREKGE